MTDETRNFALRSENGEETSVFSGRYPRQAALKAARQESTSAQSEHAAQAVELRLRERGTKTVHVYKGWSWVEETDESDPGWLGTTVTEANVSKEGVTHVEEI